ncbi:metallophosphoesterase [Puia sp. P3]|uniref:metallophosphoesterase n=1 Tax=Puia sp. P3 TaxID=3423952 RepID=UPI003D67373B
MVDLRLASYPVCFRLRRSSTRILRLTLLLLLSGIGSIAQNKNYKKEASSGHPSGIIKELEAIPASLSFLVMGDWGRHGESHQRKVAEQMSNATVGLDATFNVITGDNFYPKGVASEWDPSWKISFEEVYNQHPLYDDWYVVLGNHDYISNPDAEIAYSKISARWHMPSRYFNKVMLLKHGGTAEFFFIDTSPFQSDYYTSDEYGPNVKLTDTAAQKNGWKKSSATAKPPGNL